MLKLVVQGDEYYDEVKEEFIESDSFVLMLEHSLAAISKWESKFEKPFLVKEEKTVAEILEYIKCMEITGDFPEGMIERLSTSNIDDVNAYINSQQTATTFTDTQLKNKRGETITAELIYYWMVSFNIPFECQHWHLNRLFTLMRICGLKNTKQKPMSRNEIAARNRALNEQRRAALNTTG